MREYEKAPVSVGEDAWEGRSAQRERRFALADGKSFRLDFAGADEPGDTVMALRVCGKVFKVSRCDCVQLVFLVITLVFMFVVLFGAAFGLL